MGISTSTVVDFPFEEVLAWHRRPGALPRLLPPWQPIRVGREPEDLRTGRAELRLPAGLTWVAQHRDTATRDEFVDELTSLPLPWRHRHRFEAVGGGRTRVIDDVDTPVPAAVLRPTFRYRHRQLADDLAAVRAAADRQPRRLTVAVTGSSGLVGTALVALLGVCGHRVVRLVRSAPTSPDERRWVPDDPAPDLLDGIDAVVHLAGEPIGKRFTAEHKRKVYDSRIGPTRRLAELAAAQGGTVRTFLSASAVGLYGPDRGDEVLDENAERGDGFVADVVAGWEGATTPASDAGVRVALLRTGIVQSPRGGTLHLLRPLFAAGLGGRLGDGQQWLPWIDLDDLTDMYLRALVDDGVAGPLNATAPNPVRNAEYTRTLGAVLHRPTLLPVPPFGPRLLLGEEGAAQLAFASQRVVPARFGALGHHFRRPRLEDCLRHQLGRLRD